MPIKFPKSPQETVPHTAYSIATYLERAPPLFFPAAAPAPAAAPCPPIGGGAPGPPIPIGGGAAPPGIAGILVGLLPEGGAPGVNMVGGGGRGPDNGLETEAEGDPPCEV